MVTNELNDTLPYNERPLTPETEAPQDSQTAEFEPSIEAPKEQTGVDTKPIRQQPIDSKKSFALPSLRRPKKVIPQVRDEVTLKIEHVLEDGLSDSFQRLSPIAQQEFKIKGEETAVKIRELLTSTHVKVKKILALILDWLKLLPGVNRFFLEQEAKIKADRIIEIIEQNPDKRIKL